MRETLKPGTESPGSIIVVLFFGGLWGFAEATLGFMLHLLPRFTGMPPMAGLVLFPVGVFFMLAGISASGRAEAALQIAFVAAAIKISSLALPPVTWLFVQNPVVSILLEGAVVWLLVRAFQFGSASRWLPLQAFAAALGWRVLFVASHIFLGLRWGLLQRGAGAVTQFLLFDSLVNAVLITLVIALGMPGAFRSRTMGWMRPFPVGAVVIVAIALEHILSIV